MPYADRERRLEASRAWRKRVMPKGYGKWLYARRKLRFDDAEQFRIALETIAELMDSDMSLEAKVGAASFNALSALEESRKAEEALGPWEGGEDDQAGS